jgi:hypothetical protein
MNETLGKVRTIGTVVMSVVIGSAATGCVRLDEDHCIVNGGDFACDDRRMCVTEFDEATELSDQGDGCIRIAGVDYDLDAYFVHVKYGLPDSLRARTLDAAEDVRSVTGVLVRATEEHEVDDVEECIVKESVVRQFEEEWQEVAAVRTFLDRNDRVRADSATLEPFHVDAIEKFNERIDEWLHECEELAHEGSDG